MKVNKECLKRTPTKTSPKIVAINSKTHIKMKVRRTRRKGEKIKIKQIKLFSPRTKEAW